MSPLNIYLKKALPLICLFIFVNGMALVFGNALDAKKIDPIVIVIANILLFVIALTTLALQIKAVKSSNPHMFTNSVMGGTVLKLFIIGGAVLAYISIAGKNKSVVAVIISMVLYLLYTFLEVMIALQLNKKKNAGN